MAFLIGGANSAADTGYDIENSLRFNEPDDPQLSITPGSAGDRKTWTVSFWHKVGAYNTYRYIFLSGASSPYDAIGITPNGGFAIYLNLGSGADPGLTTSALCRDPSAWYHFVCTVDTTQGTEANRIKMYINGVQQTSFSATNYPDEDAVFNTNNTVLQTVGGISAQAYLDGYVSEFYLIDGTAYAASDFGEFDEDSGIWKPKDAKDDLTFGTNGFYLEFKETGTNQDSSGIGADTSGNDNHLAVTNLAATDQTTDTPTNNFCTFNPLGVGTNLTYCTFSEGNCKVVKSGTTTDHGNQPIGSMAFSRGKWYFEVKMTNGADTSFIGVFNDVKGGRKPWHENYMYAIYGHGTGSDSQMYSSGEATYLGFGKDEHGGDAFANDDIIGIAFDADDFKFYVSKNGGWTNENSSATANATSGADWSESTPDGYHEIPTAAAKAGFWRFAVLSATNAGAFSTEINFGNPPFAISSGNADANGYGNFEYAVPSGFYALCTKNLAEYG